MRINQINENYGAGHIENLAHEIRKKSEQLSEECLNNSFVVTEGQPRNIVHVKECDFKLYYTRLIPYRYQNFELTRHSEIGSRR